MRRKLFCTVIIIAAILFLLDFAGIPLKKQGLLFFEGTENLFVGKVISVQYADEDAYKIVIKIKSVNDKTVNFKDKLLLNYYGELANPWAVYNEEISFTTEINRPSGQRNPHCFNYGKYLKSKGISSVGAITGFTYTGSELTLKERYEKWLFMQRCLFEKELSPGTKGMILGVLFGDTSYLEDDVYETFRNNGTSHILAVSGLHVGILYSMYNKMAGKNKGKTALVLLVALLFSYGVLSMWSPSVIRASLMIAMSILAKTADLRYDMLTALSAVALILIIQNPYVIFGAGFQMSFLAVASIAFIRPVLSDKIPEFLAPMVAVNIGLLPYQIYQFNYISLVSVAANLPVVFLTGYFVPVAIVSFVIFIISDDFQIMRPVVEGMTMLITEINKVSALNGYGSMEMQRPPLWISIMTGGIIFLWTSETFTLWKLRGKWRKILICIVSLCLAAAVCQGFCYNPITHDDIVFIDVGQGDSIHIREGTRDILIDGGGSMGYNVGKNTLKPYLLRNGASDVDMALVTHMHTDHYKGLEELAAEFPVKKIITSLVAGKTIQVSDNITIESLWPEKIDREKGQEENSQCSVFMIYINEYKILITGDLDQDGEKKLLEKYRGTDKLKADILKIGHHGSKYSSCDQFLEEVSPKYGVIQTGKNNYGHPAPEVIEKCREKGML